MEEWWGGPNQDRISYTSPGFTGTFLKVADSSLSTPNVGPLPFALETMHDALVHPLTAESHPEPKVAALDQLVFGKATLDCITVTPKSVQPTLPAPRGLYPAFCFNPGTDELRFVSRYINQSEVRTAIGRFQGQNVAVGLKVTEGNLPLVEGKVLTLETVPLLAMDFAATGLEPERPAKKGSVAVVAGTLLHRFEPVYPESSKSLRIHGNVILYATIGKDGHVRELAVLSTPANDLAIAAVAAVRRWTYTPYLFFGKPANVHTTVTLQFNLPGVPPRSR
jgi:TonB family protein